jgi:hypothetical protein
MFFSFAGREGALHDATLAARTCRQDVIIHLLFAPFRNSMNDP